MAKQLRDYQADAIERLRDLVAAGRRRIVLQSPTGAGKTLIASSIIESARRKSKRVLFTVPALSLVDQTVEAFYAEGITDIGVIQAKHVMTDWSKPVQVASVQTLQRREMPEADVVIVDECHVFFKWYEKLLLAPERRNIPMIGLSATPWTKGLGAYYEELIVATRTAELIERGFLSPFRVFAPSHPDLKGVRVMAGDYHEGDLAERMNKAKLVADIVETWKEKAEGRPTICFAVNRAHADMIAKQFAGSGVPSGYMDCESSASERAEVRRDFLAGRIKVVCNVDVIGMGVDWPEVSCVIYARPTRSETRLVQNIGRSLRTAPGKIDTLILDHSDTHLRLGMVTDIGHDCLHDGKTREAVEKRIALPKECPKCSYLKPPRCAVCPNCGFKAEPVVRIATAAGDLAEFKGGKRSKTLQQFTDKLTIYGMLLWHAERSGYKQGWAANKYREIFGVWPRGVDGAPHRMPSPELASWIRSTQIRWAKGARRNGGGVSRADVRREDAPSSPSSKIMPGTLCTEEDLAEFTK